MTKTPKTDRQPQWIEMMSAHNINGEIIGILN